MRRGLVALLLLVPLFSGCLSFLDDDDGGAGGVRPARPVDDPADYSIHGFTKHGPFDIAGFGGDSLSTLVYEPVTADARADGSPIAFPVVIFLHGWGSNKGAFENALFGAPSGAPEGDPRVNLLERFARAGFIAVAYDARGHGQSDPQAVSTIAGTAEMQDLELVRQYVEANFVDNGYFGIIGTSYGGAQALRAAVDNPNFDAVVNHYGWYDMYQGLVPGNVPKESWAVSLTGSAVAGTQTRVHPIFQEWIQDGAMRVNMQEIKAAMDARSAARGLGQSATPIFFCQGMQDTLFPHAVEAMDLAGGFARAYIYTGGHGQLEEGCWERSEKWMHYFLRGVNNGVDRWPALETVDANPDLTVIRYGSKAVTELAQTRFYLHQGFLVQSASRAEFSIQQSLLDNPFDEPDVISDRASGQNAIPREFRDDPTAKFFETARMQQSGVLLGKPALRLAHDSATNGTAFQVVATLFHVDSDGASRVISRGAYAFVPGETADHDGSVEVDMDWTKATYGAGDTFVLKVASNDSGRFMPLPRNYEVTFTGASSLDLGFFAP